MDELKQLPALWATETTETQDIHLPQRYSCSWHGLVWYPAEFDAALGVAYGLTVRMLPEWRHFNAAELASTYGGEPVQRDRRHILARVPYVPEVKRHRLDDISPFIPLAVPDLGLEAKAAGAGKRDGRVS